MVNAMTNIVIDLMSFVFMLFILNTMVYFLFDFDLVGFAITTLKRLFSFGSRKENGNGDRA